MMDESSRIKRENMQTLVYIFTGLLSVFASITFFGH